jgi:TolB-like protein
MLDDTQTVFRFAGFSLDLARGRLRCGADDVVLRPKSFALLSYLVRARGKVVTKDEILSAVWPDVTVTEDSLTRCVHEVRRALGPEAAALLRTVPRRGYLFDMPPHAVSPAAAGNPADRAGGGAQEFPHDGGAPNLRPDGIAVLPFVLAHGGPDDGRMLDGLVHDVISRLARLRSFHVIARGSAFALRHLAADPQAAGRSLGVAYALAGTAEVEDGRFRLHVDLVHVQTGAVIWTDTLAAARDGFLALLPDLTDRVVHSVEMQVTAAETRRALAMPAERLDAWEHFHAGLHDAFRFDPDRIDGALGRLLKATELDPGFSRAYAAQSFCHYFRAFSFSAPDREAEVAAARRTAEDALHADDANPSAHLAFGRALWLEGDADACLQHCERSVALSPGFALGHYMIGFVETHGGDPQRGLAQMDRVLSLSPFDPFLASVQITRAFALVRLGRLDEAAIWARRAARQRNAYSALLAPAALILASAGHVEEARLVTRKLRAIAPDFGAAQLQQSLLRMSDDVAALFRASAPLLGL